MFNSNMRKFLIEYRKNICKTAQTACFLPNLQGFCAVSSYYLYKKLKEKGYKPKILLLQNKYYSHALLLINKIILDLTATQFGKKKYVVKKAKDIRKIYYFTKIYTFKDEEPFLKKIYHWQNNKQYPLQYDIR